MEEITGKNWFLGAQHNNFLYQIQLAPFFVGFWRQSWLLQWILYKLYRGFTFKRKHVTEGCWCYHQIIHGVHSISYRETCWRKPTDWISFEWTGINLYFLKPRCVFFRCLLPWESWKSVRHNSFFQWDLMAFSSFFITE